MNFQKKLVQKIETSFEQAITTVQKLTENVNIIGALNKNILDMKAIFDNNKKFGTLGETLLEQILENYLPNANLVYSKQYKIKGETRVDFAIKVLNQRGNEVLLPIDSKFPATVFREYNENPSVENLKKLENSITERFKETKKYVVEDKTTTHAFLFFPSEAMYYFFITSPFRQKIMDKYKEVLPVSPSNVILYINHFNLFAKTHLIEKHLKEVKELFVSILKHHQSIQTKYENSKKQQKKSLESLEELGNEVKTINNQISDKANKIGFASEALKLESNSDQISIIKRDPITEEQ